MEEHLPVAEPPEDLLFRDQGRPGGDRSAEGGVAVLRAIFHQPVLTGILIDVADHLPQHGLPPDLNAFEFESEELSVAAVFLVIALGVRVEEQRKWFVSVAIQIFFQTDQEMNMVIQYTVRPGFGYRNDMRFVEFQEKLNVFLFGEQRISVFGPVVNVIKFTRFQDCGFHGFF